MKPRHFFSLLLTILLSTVIYKMIPYPEIKIALDPTWSGISHADQREGVLTAFTTELLKLIADREKIVITLSHENYDQLMPGLYHEEYDAVCSPLRPSIYYEKTYLFSNIYLETGMVAVVRSDFFTRPSHKSCTFAVLNHASINLLLTRFPDALYRFYPTAPLALDDLSKQVIDGAVINRLLAESYVHHIYSGKMIIAPHPLDQEGMRMVTLNPDKYRFINRFNKQLIQLKKEGLYDKLLEKWGFKPLSDAR